ncbi:MAG: class I SAM-dependent DNA methyltransferase [Bacteroidales bacterium]|nr:class I SAM-dependent DNA methyltransferase [Bacteroidales bacterium]
MALSWNEIRSRAVAFSKDWENVTSEDAEAKSFWDAFFTVYGISRRLTATFEQPVKRLDESTGYIDLLWKGTILVEHKSRGKSLDKAYRQALDYFPGLKDYELPKYVLVSDFARFRLYDLEEDRQVEFELKDLYRHIKEFGFIAGYQKQVFKDEDPVNIHAAELMGKLHDKLKEVGYTGHPLELYLVRLLFCLFADDTSIFERDHFQNFILNRTREDGSDLGSRLGELFYILNQPKEQRLKNLDDDLNVFPYVNGRLFEEQLPPAAFDSRMRNILLECCALNWGKISPAIFGSLFQSVMNPVARRNLGAHYTSEKNILKVIKPLFLDDLWKEFEAVRGNRSKLLQFHDKISQLRFLDPACGCGNFLVISYRELRLLELEIIKTLQKGQQMTDVAERLKLNVDRFYGIELEEFPSQIAQVGMWLTDHQMNLRVSEEFGEYYIRLPLVKRPNIVQGNALQIDWQSLIDPIPWEKKEQRFDYIYGNPPFIGSKMMNESQRIDIKELADEAKGSGVLDYVSGWYLKSARYISQSDTFKTKCAFVSTNSISQGEQVGILWKELFNKYKIKIHFAHRTFKWSNEARGKAAVHVVIVGFSNFDVANKKIFEYEDIKGEPHEISVKNINPYLVEGNDVFIENRGKPICNVPTISFGNMPNDGGFLLLDEAERDIMMTKHPESIKFIKPIISAKEFLHNKKRFCIWLNGVSPHEYRQNEEIINRIQSVKIYRLKSNRLTTRNLAYYPSIFGEIRQPSTNYILIPRHSSENRKQIPIGYFSPDFIVADSCNFIENITLYHFGILHSEMHNVWVRYVCGRLKSDFRYSNSIVYNNYPWPEDRSERQKKAVEEAAQRVLDTRLQFPGSSLADLYDPLTMPPALVKAHNALDKAVDHCYRSQPFPNETKRIEFLFDLYEKYSSGLFREEVSRKRKIP